MLPPRQVVQEIVSRIKEHAPQINIGYAPEFFTLKNYVRGFTTELNGSFVWRGGGLKRTWLEK